jgi:hypothetical protein
MSCSEAADLYENGTQWTGETIEADPEKAEHYRELLASATRQRIDVDQIQEPPPTELKPRDVAPDKPAPPPFKPGYIFVGEPEGLEIIVDGVDTGKKTPAAVSMLQGGRHTVRLQAEDGELTSEKVTWLASGQRVELLWSTAADQPPESDEAKPDGEEKKGESK